MAPGNLHPRQVRRPGCGKPRPEAGCRAGDSAHLNGWKTRSRSGITVVAAGVAC